MNADIIQKAKNAKVASIKTAALTADIRRNALINIAKELANNKQAVFEANYKDIKKRKRLFFCRRQIAD